MRISTLIAVAFFALPAFTASPQSDQYIPNRATEFLGPCNKNIEGSTRCVPGQNIYKCMVGVIDGFKWDFDHGCGDELRHGCCNEIVTPHESLAWCGTSKNGVCQREKRRLFPDEDYDQESGVGLEHEADTGCAAAGSYTKSNDSNAMPTPRTVPKIPYDVRCNPKNFTEMQRFTGKDWILLHICPLPESCIDCNGIAFCYIGNGMYTRPEVPIGHPPCDNPPLGDFDPTSIKRGWSEYPTRCDPTDSSSVQFVNMDDWKPLFTCTQGEVCREIDGRGACHALKDEDSPTNPINPTQHNRAATRCDPGDPAVIQVFDGKKWVFMEACEKPKKCSEVDGESECKSLVSHPETPTPTAGSTKCDVETKWIEGYSGKSWVRIYECPKKSTCEIVDKKAACKLSATMFEIPVFDVAVPPPTLRCSPLRHAIVVDGTGDYIHFCSDGKPCVADNNGRVGCCDSEGNCEYPIFASPTITLRSRGDPWNPNAPDFYSHDTRCNPHNSSKVQIRNHTTGAWLNHYTCRFEGQCMDVNGIGACHVKDNLFEALVANGNSMEEEIQVNSLIIQKRCSGDNETEILAWNGTDYATDGVCIPPFICHDFKGMVDLAFCIHRSMALQEIWLPWPSFPARNSIGTRCGKNGELQRFDGEKFVPYSHCSDNGFSCVWNSQTGNEGCVAPNIETVLDHRLRLLRSVGTAPKNRGHHKPLNAESQSTFEEANIDELVGEAFLTYPFRPTPVVAPRDSKTLRRLHNGIADQAQYEVWCDDCSDLDDMACLYRHLDCQSWLLHHNESDFESSESSDYENLKEVVEDKLEKAEELGGVLEEKMRKNYNYVKETDNDSSSTPASTLAKRDLIPDDNQHQYFNADCANCDMACDRRDHNCHRLRKACAALKCKEHDLGCCTAVGIYPPKMDTLLSAGGVPFAERHLVPDQTIVHRDFDFQVDRKGCKECDYGCGHHHLCQRRRSHCAINKCLKGTLGCCGTDKHWIPNNKLCKECFGKDMTTSHNIQCALDACAHGADDCCPNLSEGKKDKRHCIKCGNCKHKKGPELQACRRTRNGCALQRCIHNDIGCCPRE